MEVEMKIRGLMMDPVTNMPVVILKDVGGDAVLPIWVGIYEANAIALEIEKIATPRPMTHDLLKNLLIGVDAQVRKVVVNDLRDDTFFAVIWLERNGGQIVSIDSRPSDALALALLVPPIRRRVARATVRRLVERAQMQARAHKSAGGMEEGTAGKADGPIIEGEFVRLGERSEPSDPGEDGGRTPSPTR